MTRCIRIVVLLVSFLALASVSASAGTHKVRKGDSLARIAKRYGVSVESLRQANDLQGDALRPGMKLSIPPGGKAARRAEGAVARSSSGETGVSGENAGETVWAGYHKVRKGDTFASIAARYGLSVDELRQRNPGRKARRLVAGMHLRVQDAPADVAVPAGRGKEGGERVASAPAEPPAVAAGAAPAGSYRVRKGDNLYRIARSLGTDVGAIKAANGLSGNALRPGMTLRIPAGVGGGRAVSAGQEEAAGAPGRPEAPADAARTTERKPENRHVQGPEKAPEPLPAPAEREEPEARKPLWHKVRKGDTLSSIASRYHVTVKALRSMNGRSLRPLKVGTSIMVRRGTPVPDGVVLEKRRELQEILSREVAVTGTGAETHAAGEARAAFLSAGRTDDAREAAASPEGLTDRVIRIAKAMLDLPYRFGGTALTGLDCSGYVQKVFGYLNIPLPRSAREQFAKGEQIKKEELSTGDLVFFHTYARFPSHVGIYLGDNKFIHASSTDRKVKIDSLDTPYFLRRYIGARRLLPPLPPQAAGPVAGQEDTQE